MMPTIVWQWDLPWTDPKTRMYMGLPKNPNGTGFKRLELGDTPYECPYCGGSTVYKYPHSHSKADYDRERGEV